MQTERKMTDEEVKETIAFEDLKRLGGEKAVKAAGKTRLEGKEYVVKDGDIINFRFNV